MRLYAFAFQRVLSLLILFISSKVVADVTIFKTLESAIKDEKYKKITSVLVQQAGILRYEQYFNQADANNLHDIRSASKSITSMLFGIALAQGKFTSINDKVLPQFNDKQPLLYPSNAKSNMTYEQLLTMSSPLECNDWNNFSVGHEERMYLRKDWLAFALNLPERGNPPWQPATEEKLFKRDFSYCTAGVFLLGAAIERVTQTSLESFADQYLFKPLGIDNVLWPVSPSGIMQGGGGLQISSRSLLKIGQLMLDEGKLNQQQLLPDQWVKASLQESNMAVPEKDIKYGYLWWVFNYQVGDKNIKTFAAVGNGGNYLLIVPTLNLTAVITSQAYNTSYMHDQSQEIARDYILSAFMQ